MSIPGKLPHAQLLVARDGEIVHFSHQGAGPRGRSADRRHQSLFRIASMTKPSHQRSRFMMLVEEGKVRARHAGPSRPARIQGTSASMLASGGGVPFQTRPTGEPMRMVDLLRHTSGLTYGFQNRVQHRRAPIARQDGGAGTAISTLDEFVAALGKHPARILARRGEWNYSVSTDVLGAVVQRVSAHARSTDFFAGRIFAPLGMDDTFFEVPADKIDRLDRLLHLRARQGPHHVRSRRGKRVEPRVPDLVSGGGGLGLDSRSTITGSARMCLNGGELDGARWSAARRSSLMTHEPSARRIGPRHACRRSLFSEATNAGTGFGLGFAGDHRRGAIDDPGLGRRILLGRDVLDRLLHRSRRAAHHGLHDPDEPVHTSTPSAASSRPMIYSALDLIPPAQPRAGALTTTSARIASEIPGDDVPHPHRTAMGDVLIITSDNPPVNALGAAVRQGLAGGHRGRPGTMAASRPMVITLRRHAPSSPAPTSPNSASRCRSRRSPVLVDMIEALGQAGGRRDPRHRAGRRLRGRRSPAHYRIAVPSAKIGTARGEARPAARRGRHPAHAARRRRRAGAGAGRQGRPDLGQARHGRRPRRSSLAGEDSLEADADRLRARGRRRRRCPRSSEKPGHRRSGACCERSGRTNAKRFRGFDAPAANIDLSRADGRIKPYAEGVAVRAAWNS